MSTENSNPTTKQEFFDSVQQMRDESDRLDTNPSLPAKDEGDIIRVEDDIGGEILHHYIAYYKNNYANFFTRADAQAWIERQKKPTVLEDDRVKPAVGSKSWGMP